MLTMAVVEWTPAREPVSNTAPGEAPTQPHEAEGAQAVDPVEDGRFALVLMDARCRSWTATRPPAPVAAACAS